MIKIDQGHIEVEGDAAQLMSELAIAISSITATIAEKLDTVTQGDLLNDLIDQQKWMGLVDAGMSNEEATRVIKGEKDAN